jgi:hypothetical protein
MNAAETSNNIASCPTVETTALIESPYFNTAYRAAQLVGKRHFHLATRGLIHWRVRMWAEVFGAQDTEALMTAATWACSMDIKFHAGSNVEELNGTDFAEALKDAWYASATTKVKALAGLRESLD